MDNEASASPGSPQGQWRANDIQSTSPRCPQCNAGRGNSRNLIVCIDGTANELGPNKTNVVKLFNMVNKESTSPTQEAHYWSGIGANHKSKNIVLPDAVDMAIAWSLKENIKVSYNWLAEKYTEGDQIYLFGFSRGAYQARMLAAIIYEVGLVTPSNKDQSEEAYKYYMSSRLGGQKAKQTVREFKKSFCWQDTRVHFVGVWDTVSSVGFFAQDTPLSRSSSAEHACHFRHALALDELRVKFMPEYFHEIHSLADFKYPNSSPGDRKTATKQAGITLNGIADKRKGSDIKEVWFAGSHADVGGMNETGKHHQPGNVSLLWMRREAAASGLVLKPTDIVWLPRDIDFGVTNSMTNWWLLCEVAPIRHRVSYCGAGKKAWRSHWNQSRRIIPGQKIHSSVLYAHAYKPKATLGEGFDIPIIRPGFEDANLDGGIWETGFFDASAAEEVIKSLGVQQGVVPINLDKLLFMLRFREGRESVRNITDWQDRFKALMDDSGSATIVRLVAIVAFQEASCDPEACPKRCASFHTGISEDTLMVAKQCLKDVVDHHMDRDGPRVISLLRPLTKHRILRERILTEDILKALLDSFDKVVGATGEYFVLAMDGLKCLLQCVDIRLTIVEKLKSNPRGEAMSRLSVILKVDDPLKVVAVLRMVLVLVRIPEGRAACSVVESRIKQLASKNQPLIGPLAAEICLALYGSDHPNQLNIRSAHVRANLADALLSLAHQPEIEQEILLKIFGFGATELTAQHKKHIEVLKDTALKEKNVRERTVVVTTLLKLCKSTIIREYFCEIKLLDIFVSQLARKDRALLAAFALVTCLKYPELKSIRNDSELSQRLVVMLREDCFDEAVGQFEGFGVFGELMQHVDLRAKITSCLDVVDIVAKKLGTSEEKAMRCGLMCLDTFRSYDPDGQWFGRLFQRGLEYLKAPTWKNQEEGANILSALAQTAHGVDTISDRVPDILNMLLPADYLPICPPGSLQTQGSSTYANPKNKTPTSNSPLRMMGPAYALRILTQNTALRARISNTIQYGYVKELHQNGALVGRNATTAWWFGASPNTAQVIRELNEMIEAVESE